MNLFVIFVLFNLTCYLRNKLGFLKPDQPDPLKINIHKSSNKLGFLKPDQLDPIYIPLRNIHRKINLFIKLGRVKKNINSRYNYRFKSDNRRGGVPTFIV